MAKARAKSRAVRRATKQKPKRSTRRRLAISPARKGMTMRAHMPYYHYTSVRLENGQGQAVSIDGSGHQNILTIQQLPTGKKIVKRNVRPSEFNLVFRRVSTELTASSQSC